MAGLQDLFHKDILSRGMHILKEQARSSVVNHVWTDNPHLFGERFGVSMVSPRPRCIGVFGFAHHLPSEHPLADRQPTILLNAESVAQATQAITIIELIANGDTRLSLTSSQKDILNDGFQDCISSRAWMIGSDLVDETNHPVHSELYGRQWIAQATNRLGKDYPLSPVHIGTGFDLVVFSRKTNRDSDWFEHHLQESLEIFQRLWSKDEGCLHRVKTLEGLE